MLQPTGENIEFRHINEEAILVNDWGANKHQIIRIYFFGSRVRNEHSINSDLDIAIEFECEIHSIEAANQCFAEWAFVADKWDDELSQLLPWTPDIHLFIPTHTPTIELALKRSSILISKYSRRSK